MLTILQKIPELVCPECVSDLVQLNEKSLICLTFRNTYSSEGSFINLLDKDACKMADRNLLYMIMDILDILLIPF